MITLSTADKALKDIYLDVITEQLNTKINPLLSRIEKSQTEVYGNCIKKLVPYGLSGGVGAGSEAGNLPDASENKYALFEATLKNLYGTIEISDKAIRASENNSGAFIDLLSAEMNGLINSARFNVSRMLYGDGSGILAAVSSGSGNKICVDNLKYLSIGMKIDIYNGDTLIAAKRTITESGIDSDGNNYINVDGTALSTISAGANIYMQNSKDLEITGLEAIFSSTKNTLYGLSKSDNKWLKPLYYNISGSITAADIRKAIDDMEEYSGSTADFIVCSMGVKRALHSYMLDNNMEITITTMEDGTKALMFEGVPVVGDRFCPKGTMYILNSHDFTLYELCDWRWMTGDNGNILKQKPGLPVYTATLVKYCELLCHRPAGQAKLTGIDEA